jgi:leucyl/phenylalanyl-tRNA--protein transferase
MSPAKRSIPIVLLPGSEPRFPDPRAADDHGLVAIGGDLSPRRLLTAYQMGIFPWFDEDMPLLWWCPHPRAVIDADSLHVSRSLRRTLHRRQYAVTFNCAFTRVMTACGVRPEGTWVTPDMIAAYSSLHELGHAHSFEVWQRSELVGGLYGVQCGGLFAAESMFHAANDASKVALVVGLRALFAEGVTLFDVQFLTPHLASMGAYEIPRAHYLERLHRACAQAPDLASIEAHLQGRRNN